MEEKEENGEEDESEQQVEFEGREEDTIIRIFRDWEGDIQGLILQKERTKKRRGMSTEGKRKGTRKKRKMQKNEIWTEKIVIHINGGSERCAKEITKIKREWRVRREEDDSLEKEGGGGRSTEGEEGRGKVRTRTGGRRETGGRCKA